MRTKITCGIYAIVNKINNKRYVGQSTCIEGRWNSHKSYLRRGSHQNPHLQLAWNKYGESNFSFIILIACSIKELTKYEQKFMDERSDYNVAPSADSTAGMGIGNAYALGYHHTDEAIEKIRQASFITSKGRQGMLGHTHSIESKNKTSESLKQWWKEKHEKIKTYNSPEK